MNRQRLLGWSVALLLFSLISFGVAQASWTVEALIPEIISIRVPSTNIAFAIDADTYPPLAFPAEYPASNLEDGILPVQIMSNTSGIWNLVMEIPDLVTEAGETIIPADQVMYRVNSGLWLRADASPQIIYTGNSRTNGWQEIEVEFKLELLGNEPAGSYLVNTIISAIRDSEN